MNDTVPFAIFAYNQFNIKRMNEDFDYLEINRKSWNNRVDVHLKSDFYDVEGFLKGESSLNDIELGLLGDIKGKSILHLQCHFGQDTISLGRLGANVTGVDLSDKAIDHAKILAGKANVNATFICCDIYDLPAHLNEQFDIIFTSYGVIGWLPDMNKWAQIISNYLKPNGKFVFVEFHPIVWMFDDDFKRIEYNYFNSGAIRETQEGTYTDGENDLLQECVTWNHSLREVINSLIQSGLTISSFDEFDYSPYNCFSQTVECEPNKYRIKHLSNHIPMVYSIIAAK